ncbi:MAG: M20/M25/M40 family metallo-hydrolase [Candidatus Aminicenantes bacterium]|nr:M20/M25/M40 family metallo-hydrolase [Candidatus Aminicenantes bacterium]
MSLARKSLIAALILVPLLGFAQSGSPKVDWDTVARIREEGLQRSQVMDVVGYMTDVIGPRLTLSQDMKKGHAWAKDKFVQVGLENVALEPFMDYGVAWDNEYTSIHMLEPDYQMMVGYPLAHTPGTNGKLTLPAVIVDAQTKTDLAKLKGKLKGAAILMTPPAAVDPYAIFATVNRYTDEDLKKLEETVLPAPRPANPAAGGGGPNPDQARPEDKIAFFKAEGALVVFQCPSGRPGAVTGFARPGTRDDKWGYEATMASLPILSITPEHYNRMYRILKRNIPVKVEVEVRNRIGKEREWAQNLVGEIPGSDLKDEIVIIGAHFDTWHASPSPSDDGAACAVALEAARILKAIGAKPRRTIRVAWWGGEEQGLFGSGEYVKKHFGDPKDARIGKKPEYDKLSAYFNMDYGAGAFRGIYLQGNERARRMLAAWMEPFRDMGCWAVSNQSVGSTDHVSFDRAGLPGFQFIQDRIPGTAGHTNLDFLDTIQPQDLIKNAVIMAAYAWHAATADEMVPRKELK